MFRDRRAKSRAEQDGATLREVGLERCGAHATRDATSLMLLLAPSTQLHSRFFTTASRLQSLSMFSRLSQVARHLSRPLPNFAHRSAASWQRPSIASSIMASTTNSEGKSLIHTAACLIIGDEVLGGKVRRLHHRPEDVLTRPRR